MINWLRCHIPTDARWGWGILLAALFGYGVFIGVNHAPIAAGADSAGYLGSARLLSEGRLETTLRTIPEFAARRPVTQAPLGFDVEDGSTILRPTYPLGLPLHYALFGLLAGWHWGPLMVSVLGAMAAVVVCYFCARELAIDPVLAATGAAALAVSPLLLYTSFTPMSDPIATAWCGGAFLAALRARKGRRWAAVCGVAFSVAVLVRPANVILLPVLMLVLWNWRNLWWAGVGALPGAVLNAAYNNFMYGSPLRSGYASLPEIFDRRFFLPSAVNYGETLPYVLPLMVAGILLLPVLPWRKWPRELGACVLWLVVFLLFYAFYEFTSQAWWFLRFILPAFPAAILLGLVGISGLLLRVPKRLQKFAKTAAVLLVLSGSLAASIKVARERHFMLLKEYQEPYVEVTEWAKKNLPSGALVAAMQVSSSLYYYTDFALFRWDAAEQSDITRLAGALHQSGRPLYAILFPFEETDARMRRFEGDWRKVAEVRGVTVWAITLRP